MIFDVSHDEQSASTTEPAQDVIERSGKDLGGVGETVFTFGCSS